MLSAKHLQKRGGMKAGKGITYGYAYMLRERDGYAKEIAYSFNPDGSGSGVCGR